MGASAVSFPRNGTKVDLVDTPGHVDFVAEGERSLVILDGAVLVISAVEGVQPQTRVLFSALRRLGIPMLIFVNRLDRAGADSAKPLSELKEAMSDRVVPVQEVVSEGSREVAIRGFGEGEVYLNLLGAVQMEVIRSTLADSHGVRVEFSPVQTIYKETPNGVGASIVRMGGPLNPFYATVGLRVESAPARTGLRCCSEVSLGSLPRSFQNAIEEAVLKTARLGLPGWELTDARVALTCGEYSSPVSAPADFRNVTPMVFMEALFESGTSLLELWAGPS